MKIATARKRPNNNLKQITFLRKRKLISIILNMPKLHFLQHRCVVEQYPWHSKWPRSYIGTRPTDPDLLASVLTAHSGRIKKL